MVTKMGLVHLALVAGLIAKVLSAPDSPNIIYILMDDMGFSDMSSRGGEYSTPNLDELYANSINLQYHYIGLLCSPSRSQILTGRYAWNFGLSNMMPFGYTQIAAVPTGFPTIANILREYGGYDTYAVGKWHTGYSSDAHTPLYRGFDEYYGFLVNGIWYTNKTVELPFIEGAYIDWWANENVDHYTQYVYSTFVSRNKAVAIINKHASSDGTNENPFYIYLAFQAPHETLQNIESDGSDTCDTITDSTRKQYCENIVAVDNSVGSIVSTLEENDLYDNTLIVFTTDNGGMFSSGGCNYPLRGFKATYFDGGVKTLAFVSGGYVPQHQRGTTRYELMHGSDWTPTLLGIAGLDMNVIDEKINNRINTITSNNEVSSKRQNNTIHNFNSDNDGNKNNDVQGSSVMEKNKNKQQKKGVGADFVSFDGFDLSNWLLYGDSNDNPRSSVGLSINEWDSGNNIAVVYISEVTGHLYKFMKLTSAAGIVPWCVFCPGTHETNWEPYACQIDGYEQNSNILYDLTLDFNETTNLVDQETQEHLEKLEKLEFYDLGFEKQNENGEYRLQSANKRVEIKRLMDYFSVDNVNDNIIDEIWQEGVDVVDYYMQESELFNNYLSCQFTPYTDDANPNNFDGSWAPFFSFSEYSQTFINDCGSTCNAGLVNMYMTRYTEQ